jgi:hypothetical protein
MCLVFEKGAKYGKAKIYSITFETVASNEKEKNRVT